MPLLKIRKTKILKTLIKNKNRVRIFELIDCHEKISENMVII